MQRRDFLALLAVGALPVSSAAERAEVRLLSAWAADEDGMRRFFAGRTGINAALALPARGHAVFTHPLNSSIAYVCARRPGEYLIRFDSITGKLLAQTEPDDQRRFEGHAVIDVPRNRLLATESELDQGQGRIGLYDADSLQPLGEWPSGGIGPHELLWLERNMLAVANGGILTLPETGRIKRNLDAMEPSLVLLDGHDGRRLAKFTLPDRRLGIRHLARAADGTLGVALQVEGNVIAPPLALWRAGTFRLAEADIAVAQSLGGYGAAIAAHGDRFAVTCTRGDRVSVWDTRGRHCGSIAMRKPSGIAALKTGWMVSNEFGECWHVRAGDLHVVERYLAAGRRWDNHLSL
ncbi:MAG TPA: DUF1513 domain-containing protein [Burkholderiales bacterium]|nr:DUF1513 domain-containing protein [Burkholderiales bacterium]